MAEAVKNEASAADAVMTASKKLGFYFDMKACIGCRTCQIACKDKNDLPVGVIYRHVQAFETGAYPVPSGFNYSGTCNHCENPACVAECPTGAMHLSDDGTVLHDDAKCIGCRICIWSCPYGVPQYFDDRGIVGKCDACASLRKEGGDPACVDSCVMRCLEFGPIDELRAKHGAEALTSQAAILPDVSETQPSLLINPRAAGFSRDYRVKEV